jgi:hypothetical protein
MRAHEREAYDRSLRKERYEAAYLAANGKPVELVHRRGYWYIGDSPQAYRAAQIDEMAAGLERRAAGTNAEHDRFKRVARELGPGWRFEPEYAKRMALPGGEPAAVRDYMVITANGRGYKCVFSDGVTTVSETGPTPLQALGACLHNVDLALKRLQRHLEEARA